MLHRCILGAEPQRGSLSLAARAGVSTECWGLPSVRQRRVGQLLGLSISSPLAERVSGPHCFCRPDLIHGADSSGCASLVRLQGVCCCLPPRRPTLKVYLAAKEGYSGLRPALQDPAAVSLVPELAPAGPARGQVVDMRWLRAWDASRLHRTAGRAERGLC